ncbi:MAG: protein kinase domain-containing protein [Planctomycetota bacterium]|jgi:serine/threonine protein kinase/Flp pilus assembly protein TadD
MVRSGRDHKSEVKQRHALITEIFSTASDMPLSERCHYLDIACSGDDDLRSSVDALLAEDSRVEEALELREKRLASMPGSAGLGPQSSVDAQRLDVVQEIRSAREHFPSIEGFEIRDVLGHGGMGIVYRAFQPQLRREVALKVLPAVLTSTQPKLVERFKREAAAAATVRHEHIVPVYSFGQSGGHYYYAMGLVDGIPVDRLITQCASVNGANTNDGQSASARALPDHKDRPGSRAYLHQVASWTVDVADALEVAHQHGVIHRDIKPANLIINHERRIMITDFGLAKTDFDESMTIEGEMMGTLRYVSPEQAMGGRVPVDHRTDIYSLGATLYELITLKPVFGDVDRNQLLAAVIGRGPIPPRRVNQEIPPVLEAICLKAMGRIPGERFQTAGEMAAALRSFVAGAPVAGVQGYRVRRVWSALRQRAVAIAAAVLLVAVVGTALVGGARWRQQNALNTLFDSALVYQKDQQWSAAEDAYREALTIDPSSIKALGNLAIVLKEQFNLQPDQNVHLLTEANEFCAEALDVDPDNAGLWNVQGAIFKLSGRLDEAAEAYQTGLMLDDITPGYEIALLDNLAEIHGMQGDLDLVESTLMEAAQVTRDHENISGWYVLRDLAALRSAWGDEQAVHDIEMAFDATREVKWSLYAVRAWVRFIMSDPDEYGPAIRDAFAAAEFAPPDGRVLRLTAFASLFEDEPEKAIEMADSAIEEGDLPVYNHLIAAAALADLGDTGMARARFKQALDVWPTEFIDDQYLLTTGHGVLWVDSLAHLEELRQEIDNEISQSE